MRTLAAITFCVCCLLAINSFSKEYFFRQELPRYSRIAEFSLLDQDNLKFDEKRLQGKTTILQLFFTACPQVCPMVTAKVSALSEQLKGRENIQFLSISIDPERDDIQSIKQYAEKFKADTTRWKFLTGDPQIIKDLISKSLYLDSGPEQNMHSTRLVLVDSDSVVRGYYSSDDRESLERLLTDVKNLK